MSTWTKKPVTWTIKDVGASLLDSIAGGLYSKLEVFREYVQNAGDSYTDFQRVTGKSPQNQVQVRVDERNGTLSIMDYGLGMDEVDINTAKKIAVSPKAVRTTEFVGFRGIGIWSGLAACEKLVVITTKYQDPHEYRLTIDCKGIIENISPIPLDEILQDRVIIEERMGQKDDHFTQVTLHHINRSQFSDLLDTEALRRYSERFLPVPFDPSWKDEKEGSYSEAIEKYLEDTPWTANYNLIINNEPVYRKFPDTKNIQFPTKEIITDSGGRTVAIAWVSETRRDNSKKGVITTNDGSVSNFAIRVKNFVIGGRGLYSEEGVSDIQNLKWFVGEIYITDPDIRPDTKRIRFQPSERHDEVIKAIKKFYTSTVCRARALSAQLTVLQKCTSAQTFIDEIKILCAQHTIDDGSKTASLFKVKEITSQLSSVKASIDDALREIAKKDNPDQESETVLAIRRYYRRKDVKQTIEASLGQINTFELQLPELIREAFGDEAKSVLAVSERPKRRSQARTSRLPGKPVNPEAVFKPQNTGVSTPIESSVTKKQVVDLDTAIDAFQAAVASVLGDNSEAYQKIIDRIPEELQRRGINV